MKYGRFWGLKTGVFAATVAASSPLYALIAHVNTLDMGVTFFLNLGMLSLMLAVEEDPAHDLIVDVQAMKVTYRDKVYPITLPSGVRSQLLEGTWDATRTLLQVQEQVRQTAARLPYVSAFKR